ncbi:MAG: SDR family oxidoreductase [Fimbriimonadales bacterium]|nr:SDR family oxidoreductase [Fimbriimonadales bacterium]MDW8051665.1 SDR family oxidoreductase [Armatimonadota bacterium]
MPRAVITGGAGFIGSHLADRLIAEGWQVVVIDNLITGRLENIQHLLERDDFEFIQHDVCQPFEVEGPVDYVFHLASTASPVDFVRLPLETLRVGSYGTENALELALRKGAKFLFSSTSEVYGDPLVHPQPETYWGNVNPIGIRGVYDEAKRYAESLVMAYHRYRGADTRIARIFNTYGERMRLDDGRVVPTFIAQALRGEPITVYGDGSQTRSFAYVADLIEGIWRLAHADYHEPVNLGNPDERTILEFAQLVKQLTGSDSPIVFKEFLTPDDPKQRCPDITRARQILGWEPKVSLEEGLRRTIQYFRNQLGVH